MGEGFWRGMLFWFWFLFWVQDSKARLLFKLDSSSSAICLTFFFLFGNQRAFMSELYYVVKWSMWKDALVNCIANIKWSVSYCSWSCLQELVVYENSSCWSGFPCTQTAKFQNLFLLSSGEKTSFIPSRYRNRQLCWLVTVCLRQQLERQTGWDRRRQEGGLKNCVCVMERKREKGKEEREFFSISWYNQLI